MAVRRVLELGLTRTAAIVTPLRVMKGMKGVKDMRKYFS